MMFEIYNNIDPEKDFCNIYIIKKCCKQIEKISKELEKEECRDFSRVIEWLKEGNFSNLIKLITSKPEELLKIYKDEIRSFDDCTQRIYTMQGLRTCPSPKYEETAEGKKKIEFTDEEKLLIRITQYWNKIFNYDSFINDYSYRFAEELKVDVCPYCNRQYTNTIIIKEENGEDLTRKDIIRPEFDHYFPKSKYPMFALSMYNLIPSCHICNSNIKGSREMDIKKHFHPYIKENKSFHFYHEPKPKKKENEKSRYIIKIDYAGNKKAENTCKFFYLPEIYKSHSNLADEIMDIYNTNLPERINDILEKFSNIDEYHRVTKQDILNRLYRKFIVEDENKEILGKLKKDLYTNISSKY